MKKIYIQLLASILLCFGGNVVAQSDLVITGILDGPLTGGTPKTLEIYVLNDVANLSIYGIASANNGVASSGAPNFTFPADAATAGEFIYLSSVAPEFLTYFGFEADYIANAALSVNGDDVVELYQNGVVVDYFGVIGVDGSGLAWEYLDGWAYRVNGAGPNTTFTISEWTYSGIDANDNQTTNGTATNPWPLGTYSPENGGGDVSIVEIQQTIAPNGASPLLGQTVTTSGIVTAVYGSGFWIQDGAGEWTGVFVNQASPTVLRGDEVTLTGIVEESNGLTRINSVTDLEITSSDNVIPTPINVSAAEAGTEDYESVLIALTNATCFNADLGFGEWLVNDGSGDYRVDDVLYDAEPVAFSTYDLIGIAFFSFGDFKLLPRDANDVTLVAANQLALGFEASSLSFDETDGTVTVNVEITNPAATATTVDVVLNGGTAVNGVHYNFVSPTTLTFPANSSTAQSFEIEIIDDTEVNEDRTIIFTLQNANNDPIIAIGQLMVTLEDNDAEIAITPIETVAETNAEGVAINNGQEFTIDGIVYGVDMNGPGLSFTVIDETGGIGVFNSAVIDNYTVMQGDNVQLTGIVNQFNGLTQLNPSSIVLISQGNPINDPVVVSELSEATESQLVKIECVFIPNPSQWTNSGSGFTVTVSNGTSMFDLRIDNDVDLYTAPVPVGSFDVVGIGGQFDNSSPFTSGYQLLPRSIADITPSDCEIEQPPVNDLCLSALNVADLMGGSVDETITSGVFNNLNATIGGVGPTVGYACFGEPDGSGSAPSIEATVWFSFIGDGNTYFIQTTNCSGVTDYIPDGDTQIAIYSGICAIATVQACNEDGPDATVGNYEAGLEFTTEMGQSYLMMVDGFAGAQGEFCLAFTRQALPNDNCAGAVNLNSLTGGAVNTPVTSGIFSNVGATSTNDPNPNDEVAGCWAGTPTTQQTVWFTFTGDGGMYFIETLDCGVSDYIDDGDTQMAVFTGSCDELTQVACNEDGPQATSTTYPAGLDLLTTEGETYFVMIDGYVNSQGEFCVQFTSQDPDNVNNYGSFAFDVYPNPSNDRLFVNAPQAVEAATLTNVLGQKVREFQFSASDRLELDVNGLDGGIYILQLRSGNQFSSSKIVVE